MADCEHPHDCTPGPFERFLKQSSVYREFLDAAGPDPSEIADPQAAANRPGDDHRGGVCADLAVDHARFVLTMETENRAYHFVTLVFPSRARGLETDDLHGCVRRVIDAAYPQRGLTPQVALIRDGSEVRLDLTKYWDGAWYERSLADPALSVVIYYLHLQHGVPTSPFLEGAAPQPDLMYGFLPAGGDSREFIRMSYLQARHISVDLATALLTRHKDAAEANRDVAGEQLAQQIRNVCKAHAPRSLHL